MPRVATILSARLPLVIPAPTADTSTNHAYSSGPATPAQQQDILP